MAEPQALPLPLSQLPKPVQKFCNANGPLPGRLMAAKALVPVMGSDQVTMLAQLTADPEPSVADTARASLAKLPTATLATACAADLAGAVLDRVADVISDAELMGALIGNLATPDHTVERVARTCSEALSERIAVNDVRLLRAPGIIEALYKNRNTRMSTADRLVELAARNGLELTGIPAFKDHVEALQGQLIPEATDEPLPQDDGFVGALDADADESAYESQAGVEEMKKKFKPLKMQITDMTKAEKLRLALIGNKGARAILVRDHNKQVAMASVTSPQMTVAEAAELAKSKDVSEEVLRFVGSKKEWLRNAEVKHNLVFNPKTPVGISMRFLSHLRLDELKTLARNRNVSGQLRSVASQRVLQKEKR